MERKSCRNHILICGVVLLALLVIGDVRLHGQNGGSAETVTDSRSYIFQLQLGNAVVAEYTECSGLGSGNDIVEGEAVTVSGATVIQKTPGPLRWYNITLRRTGAIDESVALWRKAMEIGDAQGAFRDGAILMRPSDNNVWVAKWTFRRGWAASLSLNDAVEELTIVHEGLEYTTSNTTPGRP